MRLRYPSITFSASIRSKICVVQLVQTPQSGGEGQVFHRHVLEVEPHAKRTLGVQVQEHVPRHLDPLGVPVMDSLGDSGCVLACTVNAVRTSVTWRCPASGRA